LHFKILTVNAGLGFIIDRRRVIAPWLQIPGGSRWLDRATSILANLFCNEKGGRKSKQMKDYYMITQCNNRLHLNHIS